MKSRGSGRRKPRLRGVGSPSASAAYPWPSSCTGIASSAAGIRNRDETRKTTGSPIIPDGASFDVYAFDAAWRPARDSAPRGRPARACLMLVDEQQRGQQLALRVEQVMLGVGRDHV